VTEARERIFLLDGHSLSYRAFYALPDTLATRTGQVTNAVYGFTSMLIKLLADERPDYIAVAFDTGAPTERLEKYADYKAGRRETPDLFREQLPLIMEVCRTLAIPVIETEGHEADDALATLAVRAKEEGLDATIVTADRDFFQVVQPGVSVMFNRRGISEIDRYDPAAIEERYGLPPERYLDFVALKGDTSDNIPGVPGVGEKTAAKLVQEFGSVEEILEHVDDLKGKLRESIDASRDQLALNKDLARLRLDIELEIGPRDCAMGGWDIETVRSLFNSLEFRTLFDRLLEIGGAENTAAGPRAIELKLEPVTARELERELKTGCAVQIVVSDGRASGIAVSSRDGTAAFAEVDPSSGKVAAFLADPSERKLVLDSKDSQTLLIEAGADLEGVGFDASLAGYLLDPSWSDYSVSRLGEAYLGFDPLQGIGEEAEGQLFGAEEPARGAAATAAAVAMLAPVMGERIDQLELRELLSDVELPLASVLARMQARGVAVDVAYLKDMADGIRETMAQLRDEIYGHADEEFNLNSPPQLRKVLYEKLGLQPGKKTPKGELSTDASVLEKLRDSHPIVDALLHWRELDKLNSTYLEALPRLIDPKDGRIHTSFNQTVAATGRLSSSNPNLQNIPVRSELGRRIRRAFVPGSKDDLLLVADYSQIELRVLAHMSEDPDLMDAFRTGTDVHAATAARVFGLPQEKLDREMRRRAKMVNYGLAYGLTAFGLAQRLDIAVDEASEIMDSYFANFPGIRQYLDGQVDQARVDGFTETLLKRRRYVPELQSSNPRVRDLGRRQALNAPIQGSASDVFKLAMIKVDRSLRDAEDLQCHMLLTVHDELVFEVPKRNVEAAAGLVRQQMESAYSLRVPLVADIGWGENWADAAPEGH
jgi:DNA polymerase-1